VNDPPIKAALPSITARPSAAEKARFAWLAERAGMSESALALVAIRGLLAPKGNAPPPATGSQDRVAATDRVTIRLRPGDGAAIARRAAERGMKSSAYLAAMARAHLRMKPPLPGPELAALKEGVSVLAELSHVLARIGLAGPEREVLRKDLAFTRATVVALEQRVHDLAKAALMAWETGYE
jgi:hypothetical protein